MGSNFRNQTSWTHEHEDRQGIHTDERFTGRGGTPYWDEEERDDSDDKKSPREQTGYNSGYNRGGVGYGGYPEGAATSGKERSGDQRGNQKDADSVGVDKTEASTNERTNRA